MKDDNNFIERIETYVWWVKNHSRKISPDQIENEVKPLIEEIEKVRKNTGINYSALDFLYKLQYFDFDILKVREYDRKIRRRKLYFFA